MYNYNTFYYIHKTMPLEKIDIKDWLDEGKAKQINEIAAKSPKDFSKELQKQIEWISDKKKLAKDLVDGIEKNAKNIKESDCTIFKTLLDNISQLDPDIKNTPDYKKRVSIVTNKENFTLWAQITKETNLKTLINNKDTITANINRLWANDLDLKNNLDGIYKNYQKRVETHEKHIQDQLSPYTLAVYGIIYDKNTWELKDPSGKMYPLFNIDWNKQWQYDPKIITDKGKTYLHLDKDTSIELTINKLDANTQLSPDTIKKYIGFMQAENNMNWLNYASIKTYVDNITTLDTEHKWDLLVLLNEAKKLRPTDTTEYDLLIQSINKTPTKESQEKTDKTIEKDAMDIIKEKPSIETAKKLFDTAENRVITNKILETVKNNRTNLSPDYQKNITDIIKLYIQGQYPEISSSIVEDDMPKIVKTGKDLPHRPETYNGLPVYLVQIEKPGNPVTYIEIFPWTEKDIHSARSQKLEFNNFKSNLSFSEYDVIKYKKDENWKDIIDESQTTYKTIEEKDIDLTNISDKESFKKFMRHAHEQWSYEAFAKIIKKNSNIQKYITENLETVLADVKNNHEYIKNQNKKEVSQDQINGYYRVIAETIVNTGDKWIVKAYLTYIKSNPSYLGDGQSRIDTRNIVGKRGDENILKSTDPADKELQNLFLLIKTQIDPQKAKGDILEQIDDNLELFMDKFGPAIAMVVDFFWWKWAFMKMIPSAAMREKFMERFKESNQMSADQIKNFNTIHNAFNNIDKNPIQWSDGNPETPENIIEATKKHKKTQEELEKQLKNNKNFAALSPYLVANIIKEHNKKPWDPILKVEDFVLFDEKWLPKTTKESDNDTGKELIIKKLLDPASSMRKSILTANKNAINNAWFDLRTQNEIDKWQGKDKENVDINGSKKPKWIGSFADVATYIAAYVTTAWKPPYNQVISENDIVKTGARHKKSSSEISNNTQEKNKEETEFTTKLNSIKDNIINNTNKIIPDKFEISKTDSDHKPYVEGILDPLYKAFWVDKVNDKKSFSLTAENKDLLDALQSKPQVLKDLITYTAATQKTTIEDIAKLLNKDATSLENIHKIEATDKGIVVTINDTKKFTINEWPKFEQLTA